MGLGPGRHQLSSQPDLCLVLQRACYLSINPQKDETLETEKAQYYLPDGSTIEVGSRPLPSGPKSTEPKENSPWGGWSQVHQFFYTLCLEQCS